MQEVDIHEVIESTLTMLGHKLKNVTLVRAFDRSVPRIMAYGSELNQVWTNLIDNASSATVIGAKLNLNPAPGKHDLRSGFLSTVNNCPAHQQEA